jgi:hypothetical protein
MRSEGRREVLEPSELAGFGRDRERRHVSKSRPTCGRCECAVVGLVGIAAMLRLPGSVVRRGVSVPVPDVCAMQGVFDRCGGKQLNGKSVGTELERERALRRGHESRRNERPKRECNQRDRRERGAGGRTEEAASHGMSMAEFRAPASQDRYELQASLQLLPVRRWHPCRELRLGPPIQVPCLRVPGPSSGTSPMVRSMQQTASSGGQQ